MHAANGCVGYHNSPMPDFRDLVDLAGERLGASVLYANDDFFAPKENLIKPSRPVWKEDEYTDRGKWMDGWESRRRRTSGHDFAIIRLGARGVIHGAIVDTAFFRGNYPESCSLEGTSMASDASIDELLDAGWQTVMPRVALKGDSENVLGIDPAFAFTHVRFNIFPDGGVGRLRLHGHAVPDWHRTGGLANEIDLAAVENGGEVLACSDMFFGPKNNLIMPGRAANMSDGWETRRRRGPGHDWVIVQLAIEGVIDRIEIDTNHFKGNYPDTASIDGSNDGETWSCVLPRTKLQAHTRHVFVDEIAAHGPFMQLRLNVYPDGGVSRLRVWGKATQNGRRAAAVRHVNTLANAGHELRSCCASSKWIEAMTEARPFDDWESMIETANRIELTDDDWQEAFRAHPRIGERVMPSGARDPSPAARLGMTSQWSADEQSGTRTASNDVMNALAEANREYEARFGHVFLICATGRSADDMLADLRQRMKNDPATELRIAAGEHRKITALRLDKLVL